MIGFDHLIAENRYTALDEAALNKVDKANSEVNDEVLREIIENLSDNYLKSGQPFLAAASHLSINDPNGAIIKLFR